MKVWKLYNHRNNKYMKKFLIILLILGAWLPVISFGQLDPENLDNSENIVVKNYLKEPYRSVPGLINAILEIIVQIGSIILVISVVLAGLQYVMARGNSSKIEKAHQTLLYTLIGAAIVLGAFVISEGIQATVGQLST